MRGIGLRLRGAVGPPRPSPNTYATVSVPSAEDLPGSRRQTAASGGDERAVIERYLTAFEAADVPGLTRLLADDVILEMPPVALWLAG
jgi:hypothetical protein